MARSRSGNTAYLLRLWAAPIALVALSTVFWSRARWARGDFNALLVVAAYVACMFGLARFRRARLRAELMRHLHEPTPEAMIALTRKMSERRRVVPHLELIQASTVATYRALYGQFGRAHDELDQLSWNDAPGLYRAAALHVRALIHYLSADDAAAGLRDAREAEELGRVPAFAPGAKTSRRAAQTYIDIGLVLTGGGDEALAAALEQRVAAAASPTERLITLWAAAIAHETLGRSARSAALFGQLKELAPYCRPLLALPRAGACETRGAAADVAANASVLGMCALHPDAVATVRCVRCGSFACQRCAHGVSERASICSDCRERYRELRQRNLPHESRLRAAGLLLQMLALFVPLLGVALVWPVYRHDPVLAFSFATYMAILGIGAWLFGSSARRLRVGSRYRMLSIAAMLIGVIPVGTATGAYLLWLNFSAPGKSIHSDEYVRAVAATPELLPRSPWPFALSVIAAMLLNAALLLLAARA